MTAAVFLDQLGALLLRLARQMSRRPVVLFVIALPAAFVGLIQVFEGVVRNANALRDLGIGVTVPTLQRCSTFDVFRRVDPSPAVPCVTIMYAPNSGTSEAITKRIAELTGLVHGEDVKGFRTLRDAAKESYQTHAAVDFFVTIDAKDHPDEDVELVVRVHHNDTAYLSYGSGNTPMDPVSKHIAGDGRLLALKRAIDEAAAGVVLGVDAPSMKWEVGGFPDALPPSQRDSGVMTTGGVPILLAGFFSLLITAAAAVDGERKGHHLVTMRMMGVYDSAFWLAWFAVFAVIALLAAVVAAGVGAETGLPFFSNSEFGVHVVAFWAFGLSLSSSGLLLGAAVPTRAGLIVGYVLAFIVAVVCHLAIIFACATETRPGEEGYCYSHLYDPSANKGVLGVASMLPSFHFGKYIEDVTEITVSENAGNDGEGPLDGFYSVDQLSQPLNITDRSRPSGQSVRMYYDAPPAGLSVGVMIALAVAYTLIAAYASQVIVGDSGAAKKPWFFLSLQYWGLLSPPARVQPGDTLAEVMQRSADRGSVEVHKMSKTYRETTAFKECTLTFHPSQIFALLGQNGAGKSTLIGLITGRFEPTHGTAFVQGADIRTDMAQIQRRLGVCTQDDVLHADLTAAEHVGLHSQLKRLPTGAATSAEITEAVLAPVGLRRDAHRLVGTFSGGMKRRLSVALALMGDPTLVTLDEPTTGMDPLKRREVWRLVQGFKEGRIIVLTTHSMEEADLLGDTVGVLIAGRLRALGSPLFLKERFGSGYHIAVSADAGRVADVEELARRVVPSARIERDASGVVTLTVSRGARTALPRLLRDLERSPLAREIGVSHSTLDEVFLALVAKDHDVNSATVADDAAGGTAGADAAKSGYLTISFAQPVRLTYSTAAGASRPVDGVVNIHTEPRADATDTEETVPLLGGAVSAATAAVASVLGSGLQTSSSPPSGSPAPAEGGVALPGASAAVSTGGSGRADAGASPSSAVAIAMSIGSTEADEVGVVDAGGSVRATQGPHPSGDLLTFLADEAKGAYQPGPLGQVQGLLLKNAQLQVRERKTLCCGGCCALTTLLLLLIIQVLGDASGSLCAPNTARAPAILAAGGSAECSAEGFANAVANPVDTDRESSSAKLTDILDQADAYDTPVTTSTNCDDDNDGDGDGPRRPGGGGAVSGDSCAEGARQPDADDAINLVVAPTVFWDNVSLCVGLPAPRCVAAAFEALAYLKSRARNGNGNGTSAGEDDAADKAREKALDTALYDLSAAGDFPGDLAAMAPDWAALSPTVAEFCDQPRPRPEKTHVRLVGDRGGLDLLAAPSVFAGDGSQLLAGALAMDEGDKDFESVDAAMAAVLRTQEAWRADRLPCTVGSCVDQRQEAMRRDEARMDAEEAVREFKERFPDAAVFVDEGETDADDFRLHVTTRAWSSAHARVYTFAATSLGNYDPRSDSRCRGGELDALVLNGDLLEGRAGADLGEECSLAFAADDTESVAGDEVPTCSNWLGNRRGGTASVIDAPNILPEYLHHLIVQAAALNALWLEARRKACAPECPSGAECGSDGCGGSCGSCGVGQNCSAGRVCVDAAAAAAVVANGTTAPGAYACVPACGDWELCTANATCAFSTAPRVRFAYVRLPALAYWNRISETIVEFGTMLLPALCMLLLPSLAFRTAFEREEGLVDAAEVNGTPRWVFLGASYAFDVTMGAAVVTLVVSLGALVGLYAVLHASASLWALLIAQWAHAQACISLFLSALPVRARAVSLACVMGVLLTLISGYVLVALVPDWPEGLLAFPPLAFARMWSLLLAEGGTQVLPGSKLAVASAYLAAVPTGLLAVGLVMHGVGTRQLAGIADRALRRRATVSAEEVHVDIGGANAGVEGEGASGVTAEHGLAIADGAQGSHAVVAQGLSMAFNSLEWRWLRGGRLLPEVATKRAVRGLSFVGRRLECLGLLGPNGAGKTTTFRMLTGKYKPTEGKAFVDGAEAAARAGRVGFVPQFDVVWPELTVKAHLTLFARLVGARRHLRRSIVQQVAEMVSLDGDAFNQAAKNLSGGMRRRLSLGLALIGNPAVLFCDEPTTGLDPESRRAVWKIVEKAKRGRSVVLTTHSMEEADALCSRIAVVADGQLQCIGTPLHLKSAYGSGYKLAVNLKDSADIAGLEALIASTCAAHTLEEEYAGARSYRVQLRGGLADLFSRMDVEAPRLGVADFSVAQPSLEDAFINIVKAAERTNSSSRQPREAMAPAGGKGQGNT